MMVKVPCLASKTEALASRQTFIRREERHDVSAMKAIEMPDIASFSAFVIRDFLAKYGRFHDLANAPGPNPHRTPGMAIILPNRIKRTINNPSSRQRLLPNHPLIQPHQISSNSQITPCTITHSVEKSRPNQIT
jgi:hypothetical protein